MGDKGSEKLKALMLKMDQKFLRTQDSIKTDREIAKHIFLDFNPR